MATVKQLLREIEDLRMREHVWLGIREYLEGFTPEGEGGAEATIDGVKVPMDTVLDVLSDIDADCLGPVQARIRKIEAAKVSDGKAKEDDDKEKAKSKKRASKRS